MDPAPPLGHINDFNGRVQIGVLGRTIFHEKAGVATGRGEAICVRVEGQFKAADRAAIEHVRRLIERHGRGAQSSRAIAVLVGHSTPATLVEVPPLDRSNAANDRVDIGEEAITRRAHERRGARVRSRRDDFRMRLTDPAHARDRRSLARALQRRDS